jgi:UDP-3-O-[3-hydroxymyristoyl] glucosamine N-acyltransferase
LKLLDLATRLGCRLEGDGDLEVVRLAGIDQAGSGDLTFFANPRYTSALGATRATAVILGPKAPAAPCAMLRSETPYLTFALALEVLQPAPIVSPGVHPLASVDVSATLEPGVAVGPFAVIEAGALIGARSIIGPHAVIGADARIGTDCRIHAHVSVRERVSIGHRVVVQNGAVIGSDGFGFATRPDGTHHKIPQVGAVVIEDDVEIGANAAIDRPSLGETRIKRGAKIDNLVQIAHGVVVGEHSLLAAQVGVAGSTVLEDHVTLAGQVGVAGHLTIGRGVIATAQTGIPNSLEAKSFVSGYPAIDNRDWLKASAVFRRLPELRKAVAELDRRLRELAAERAAGAQGP